LSCYVIARVCWHARNGQIVLALEYPFNPGTFPARTA